MGGVSQVTATLQQPLWSTGQAILEHYKMQLPAIDPEFANPSKLRVRGDRMHSSYCSIAAVIINVQQQL